MTDETKKLFDAPWKSYPLDDVGDASGSFICSCETSETARRIARLPELYDALLTQTYSSCKVCNYNRCGSYNFIEKDELISGMCPCKDTLHGKNCFEGKVLDLLRKVRDVE